MIDSIQQTLGIPLTLWLEKKPGHGEDAEPTLALTGRGGVIAVYDGMGGAGSAVIQDVDGASRTGAYCASRLAKEVIESDFREKTQSAQGEFAALVHDPERMTQGLAAKLTRRFGDRVRGLETSHSKLRSTLIRSLPTTLAALYFEAATTDEPCSRERIWAVWAGDSRAYVLRPGEGLQQLTQDDVKSGGDAFVNLSEDSPLSNCLHGDGPLQLKQKEREVRLPAILLVCTDGCFGFLSTPAHFEYLVLNSLLESDDAAKWELRLREDVARVARDDASLALLALGWRDFGHLRDSFRARQQKVAEEYVDAVSNCDEQLRACEEIVQRQLEEKTRLSKERDRLRGESWLKYQEAYEALMKGPGHLDEKR